MNAGPLLRELLGYYSSFGALDSVGLLSAFLGPTADMFGHVLPGGEVWLIGSGIFLLGLLGLTTENDPADTLSELADKVKRLADGDSDIDFPTERDDEIGRLSEALDGLKDQFHHRDERATERSGYEQQLERYGEYTDALLDAIDDTFYVLNEEGYCLRWNQVLPEVTGYSDEEIEGMHALEFFPEGERERIERAIGEVFESGRKRVETDLLTKDGERIPYEFLATRLEDSEDNPVLIGIGRDITERKEHERKLRERERELSTLMDNIQGMVYRAKNERGWPFEFVSEGSREVTGYEPETLESGAINWSDDVIVEENDELWDAVQEAVENNEPYRVTFQIQTADDEQRWVWEQGRGVFDESGNLEALEGVILDITEQKKRERELEQTTDFLEETQQIASVGGWELDVHGEPPYKGTFTDELYRIHELPMDKEVDMEMGLDYYHPSHQGKVREAVEHSIETGERYDLEARFITAEENKRWVRTTGIPVYEDGEVVKLRGALQDITDRKEHELALKALQETTQGLLGTETDTEVAQFVVENAAEFLDTPGIAIYLLDDETNRLKPTAFSATFADLSANLESVSIDRGDSVLWNAVLEREQRTIDAETAANSHVFGPSVEVGQVLPIGDYGVFVIATTDQTIEKEDNRLVETLVATTEAALDRLESEIRLRERESELEIRNQRLRRQIQINNIIRSVHTSLIGSESQEEIEQAVCERLVDAEQINFAWIGAVDTNENRVVPRTWDGDGQEYLDELSLSVEEGTEPAVLTARTGEPTVVSNVVEELGADGWRQRALLQDFHSVLSVPLFFDEFSTGVLTVYADEPGVFGTLERTVFTELGESIASSIITVNTRQALHSDTLVELTIQLGSDSFFTRLSEEADCQLKYEGLASEGSDRSRLFFTTTGAKPETILEVLDTYVSVTDAGLISEFEDECLFEATVTEETIPSRLARHGGRLQSIQSTESGLEIVVDVPTTTEIREFIRMLEEEYADVELVGRRDVERSMQTRQEFFQYLLDGLTDRQLEVLKTAYFAGFFEWPRTSNGEEIAEMLDITQPTVNRHLRLSQKHLLEGLFEHSETEHETEK